MTHYHTIEKPATSEYKDRGSRFLAYVFPVQTADDFKKKLRALKEEHPKAAHHCFAYRLGTDRNNFRAGDDGEPAGSAGKPILNGIDSKGLTDVAVVVVRYFGGTLLGVPGLIAAYKTATSFALQLTPVVQKPVLQNYILQFSYDLMNEVMTVVKKYNCVVIHNEAQLFCLLKIGVPKAAETSFLDRIADYHNVEIQREV